MKKFYILLIVVLGLFMMPTSAFACKMNSGNHCCKGQTSSQTDKKCCCGKDTPSKSKSHDGCGGKCGHSKCGCASICPGGITLVSAFELRRVALTLIPENHNFYHFETNLSSGFIALWLIPKIS